MTALGGGIKLVVYIGGNLYLLRILAQKEQLPSAKAVNVCAAKYCNFQ